MKIFKNIGLFFIAAIILNGCAERKFGNIDPFVGDWNVSMRVEKFDSQGNLISDSLKTDLGIIKIAKDPEGVSFNLFSFPPSVTNFVPLDYLVSVGAVAGTSSGGENVVYISPDIDNERAKFWGISSFYGSVADIAMITKMKNDEIEFTSAKGQIPPANDSTSATLSELQHLILKKR